MSQPPRLQLPFDLIFRIGPKQLFTFHTFLLLYMIATPAESYLEQLKLSYRNHVSSFSIDILIEIYLSEKAEQTDLCQRDT